MGNLRRGRRQAWLAGAALALAAGLAMACPVGPGPADAPGNQPNPESQSQVRDSLRSRAVYSIGRGLALLPHQHPDVRPFGVALLSSLDEAGTLALLQDLQEGLTGLGWLPPPDPAFAGYSDLAGFRAWWGQAGRQSDLYVRFVPDLLECMPAGDVLAGAWWDRLDGRDLEVDLVILAGTAAVRSYRYREDGLTIPVFHYGLAPADTRLLAESASPSRAMYPLVKDSDLFADLEDLMGLAACRQVLIPGDFDPLELMAFRVSLGALGTVLGGQVVVADRAMLEAGPADPALTAFLAGAGPRGILASRNMDRSLEARVVALARRDRIPLFASAGTSRFLHQEAALYRQERPRGNGYRMMALHLVEVLSGLAPGAETGFSQLPVRYNQERARAAGLRIPGTSILALRHFQEAGQ